MQQQTLARHGLLNEAKWHNNRSEVFPFATQFYSGVNNMSCKVDILTVTITSH